MKIEGTFAPVPTPLDRARAFDADALGAHLRWLASAGLDGALVLGSNGEFPSFTMAERLRIAEAAGVAGSSLELLLGVGSCALEEVLAMVEAAADLGYKAVLCPPPFYLASPPPVGVAAFFEAVLERARLPVLLYHVPQLTGVPLEEDLLDRLGDHPQLAGVKDSSGRREEMERLLRRFGGRSYLVGSDRLVSKALGAGGSGSITAAASVVPRLVASVRSHPARQEKLDAVRSLLEEYGLIPGVKAVLRARGLGHYTARPPMTELEPGPAREVVRRLDELIAAV